MAKAEGANQNCWGNHSKTGPSEFERDIPNALFSEKSRVFQRQNYFLSIFTHRFFGRGLIEGVSTVNQEISSSHPNRNDAVNSG